MMRHAIFLSVLSPAPETSGRYRAEVLRVGHWDYPDLDGGLNVTPELLTELAGNFYAGAKGFEVPLNLDHDVDSCCGWVKSLEIDGDRLVATEIKLTRQGDLPFGATATAFTGYGGVQTQTSAQAGQAQLRIDCADRKRQLMSPRFALPWMDAWNVYYAMFYLAQQGGLTIDDCAFGPLVPPTPFDDRGDGEGGEAYFLPIGAHGSVQTRLSGVALWDAMTEFAVSLGFMLFFDALGKLQFRRFRVPTGVKYSFFESDNLASGQPRGCWDVTATKSMDQVRSDTIVIGVDVFRAEGQTGDADIIAFKQSDPGVIDDPAAFNHLGYPNPAVWSGPQFATPDYAELASIQMHRTLRTPGLDVALTTWLQPDVFPLDVIRVESRRLGLAGIRFLVLDVRHSLMRGQAGQTTIVGRHFVPSS